MNIYSNQFKNHIKSFFIVAFIWFIILMLYFNIIFQAIDLSMPGNIDLVGQYLMSIFISILISILAATIEMASDTQQIKKYPFIIIVIVKTILFITVLFITVAIFYFLQPIFEVADLMQQGYKKTQKSFYDIIVNREFLLHGIYMVITGFAVNLLFQINKKMGRGVLHNLFIGKYSKPRQEKKIIMFLDLESSTSIGEKLSPHDYSSFLKDFFYDIDFVIDDTKGFIYQYVGDEVVILWEEKLGAQNSNCLRCFFDAKERINSRKEYYLNKYNNVPKFKAGLHFGDLIVNEVGASKREIVYHGDTMNSASRIRSACKTYQKEFLISAEVLSLLNEFDDHFQSEAIGLVNLIGKENIMVLFSVYKKI